MKTVIYILLFVLILFSCKSTKSAATAEDIKTLETLIKEKNFKIVSDWAYPQVTNAMQQVLGSGLLPPGSNASSISLIGNSNYLTISGDSINSFLPYFGERQMGGGYNNDSAIELSGVLEDYNVEKKKNESYIIKFKAKSKVERFNTSITIFPNLKAEIIMNSASRFPIRYSGKIKSDKKE